MTAFANQAVELDITTTNANPSLPSHFDNLTQQNPELSTFVLLVNKAELKDLFNGTGPFTVFAPTDEAFKKLGHKKLEALMKPENRDHLSTILMFHIIPGKYMSKTLKIKEPPSIKGKSITYDEGSNQLKVNNATIVKPDIIGPNGVIHEIDTVLTP